MAKLDALSFSGRGLYFYGQVGGWAEKVKIKLNSTQVEIEVEVRVELRKSKEIDKVLMQKGKLTLSQYISF